MPSAQRGFDPHYPKRLALQGIARTELEATPSGIFDYDPGEMFVVSHRKTPFKFQKL
jgi:hypothetical protein